MKHLRGKLALVTGASRGIGPNIVRALAAEGMNLVLSARTEAALHATADSARAMGVRVSTIAADLIRRTDVEALAAKAEAESGGVAVLVNNAGIECALPYEHVDPKLIDDTITVNLTTPMILTRLLLPHMIRRGEGHIVNISSLSGLVATPYEEPYAAAKHGLVGFSRSLRLSLRSDGHPIGVSVLCPAFVSDAGMYENARLATGAKAPMMIGTVSQRKLAKAVVKAIVDDQPEVVVSGMPMKPFLLTQAASPRLAGRLATLVGVPAMFKRWADASLKSAEKGRNTGAR